MLTAEELSAAAADLAHRVEGGQVQKIWQPDAATLVFRVRRSGATVWLTLSADPRAPRLGERSDKPPAPDSPPGLCQWARAAASGRRLVALEHTPGERVITLVFPEARLVGELFGRRCNLYGLDADGHVRVVARPEAGRTDAQPGQVYTPPPGRPQSEEAPQPAPVAGTALRIEAEAGARVSAQDEASEAVARRRLITQARRRLNRLLDKVSADEARAGEAEAWKRKGELLMAQLHRITPGASEARVQDWYADGAPEVAIELDPALDGPANAQQCFVRYKRAKAGQKRAADRVAEVERRLEALEAIETRDLSVEATEEALIKAGLRPPVGRGGGGPRQGPRLPFRRFVSDRGEMILVGRGGVDNHQTTFRHAKGNDHWLHVRDAAGAHVVVPQPARGRDPHPETLLDAAALAIHHSKLKGEPGVEVSITRRKHVRAVPGGPPGRVFMADARTLTVAGLKARITRLYQAAQAMG